MWIRSQDRLMLVNTNAVYADYQNKRTIWAADVRNDACVIGAYKTEERCIGILDEIQGYIAVDIRDPYQMPEK